MKTCPTCGARAFDDAEVCFGCLLKKTTSINPVESQSSKRKMLFSSTNSI